MVTSPSLEWWELDWNHPKFFDGAVNDGQFTGLYSRNVLGQPELLFILMFWSQYGDNDDQPIGFGGVDPDQMDQMT